MDNIPNGACEQGGENESNEKRFVLYVTLPSLEEMALHRVALALWYNYIHRMEYNEFEKKWAEKLLDTGIGITLKYWEDYDNTIESLKIPRSIKEKLETALDSVSNKTIWCLLHFKEYMFSEKLRKYSIDRFDVNCCVWLPNGKVDLGKTGLKLLSSRGLSDIQKFAIMSEFCMENEMKKFSLHSLPESFVEQLTIDDDYLMYYWFYYLKNDLHNSSLNVYDSVDVTMAYCCQRDHRIAFEYFWNRLSIFDQVDVIVSRIDECVEVCDFDQEAQMLSKMSWQQQRSVLSFTPDAILINLWCHLDSHESAIRAWKHCKDVITAEQFGNVVKDFFYFESENEEKMRLFMQMWDTASGEQRNHVIQYLGETIRWLLRCDNPCSTAIEFLNNFLSIKNEDSQRL